MLASVVIPTRNREILLKRCLKSLSEQNLFPKEYEVIVCDDAPSLLTKKTVEGFSLTSPFKLRYIPVQGNHGPAAARNAGWKQANAPIIAFIDDDCIADPKWLKEGLRAFSPEIAAVSGKISVPLPPKPSDHEICISWMENCHFLTANSFYRKNILFQVGGLDENFKMAWREDSDLYFTLLSKGLKVAVSNKALVTHPVKKISWGGSLKDEKKNMYNALLFKKHPWFFRKFIESKPPWLYYIMAFSAITGFIGAFFSSFYYYFILAWLLLVIFFAAKRLRYPASKSLSHILEMMFTSLLIPFFSVFWRIRGGFRFRVIYF